MNDMKIFTVAILLSFYLQVGAQTDSTFKLTHTSRYKHITLNIIKYLGIPFRNSHSKDGRLLFAFDKPAGFGQRSPAYGMFVHGPYLFRRPDTINVIYTTPIVFLSRNIYNDLKNNHHSSEKYIRALGCVLHEITHYYQHINYNYLSYWPSGDYYAYFCQPYERDAYAVEAYFYLSRRKPRDLEKILARFSGDNKRLKLELINAHSQYIKRPFPSGNSEVDCP